VNEQKLLANWALHFSALGGTPLKSDIAERLLAGWQEGHRAYHTLQHLGECLELVRRWAAGRDDRHVLALALWFHDFVYDTKGPGSEDRSIAAARRMLATEGLDQAVIDQVARLIEVTKHGAATPQTETEQLMVDIDLAILGAGQKRFEDYCAQVRQEYGWVPEATYRAKRIEFLESLLARESLFMTAAGRAECEVPARRNLAGEVARMRAQP
jgi:predicted metal-dependent HD superfamily phosphohydrolase